MSSDTVLLKRNEVASLLGIDECMDAVERAFKMRAIGEAAAPGILGIHTTDGGFHIKAGILHLQRQYFVAKINANFPMNPKCHGLPTIQGVIAVSDASNGKLLALMDAMEITTLRTGAATGVAAKYLARADAKTATIIGCGNQGKISLRALMKIRELERVYVNDIDPLIAKRFVKELGKEFPISIEAIEQIDPAIRESDICVTCTPSKKYFLKRESVMPGTFIAAVGSDNEDKQELDPRLLAENKVVVDSLEQTAKFGELHHALDLGIMNSDQVYSELGDIIAGHKKGRTSPDEIIIFDSTGIALQDVAAAAIVYEKAVQFENILKVNFGK
jgi:alanine dehydrogenase